jgi:hypothetical protein
VHSSALKQNRCIEFKALFEVAISKNICLQFSLQFGGLLKCLNDDSNKIDVSNGYAVVG